MSKLINLKEKGLGGEILRFVVTGGVATIIDFLVSYLVASFLPDSIGVWKEVIYTAAGFAVSLIANYVLSVIWVFKNVDESVNPKSSKNVLLFIGLSAVGLGLGIAIMIGFDAFDEAVVHSDFESWLEFITRGKEFSFKAFGFAVLFFGFKTLVVLVWNYLSRKKLIFKSKDESSSNQIE